MFNKGTEAFVRAKPAEIAITETYRYKAEISDNNHLSFQEANGEIKVKFLYDGQGFHWKTLNFLRDLVPRNLTQHIGRYIEWTLLDRLSNFLKSPVGPKAIKKCFDIDATKDARKNTGQYSLAKVGHLVLQGFQKPSFRERWPESKALPLTIPIDNLEKKFTHSQKYELCYSYLLQKPENPLVSLDEIRLTDESKESLRNSRQRTDGSLGQLYSKVDEELYLKLKLSINGGKPQLDEDNQLPDHIVKYWWQSSQKIQSKQLQENEAKKKKKRQNNRKDHQSEVSVLEQIVCMEGFPSAEELREVLNNLALRQGGYLLIRLDKSEEIESLKEQLLRVSLKSSIPILEPYKHDGYKPNKKPLAVVPVPKKLTSESDYRRSHLSLRSEPPIIEVDRILTDVTSDELTIYLSAIANTANGKLGLVISSSKNDLNGLSNPIEALKANVWKAARSCQPQMDIPYNNMRRAGDSLVVLIKRALFMVYTVNGIVYIWKDGRPEPLSVEKSYKFIKDCMALNYPLITPLPFISYACLDWSYFDPRETDGVRYDPQKKIIKWPDKVWFRQIPDHKFEVTLPLSINRPIELYRQGSVSGQVHIELENNLKSGLTIEYFDALGKYLSQYQAELPKIKKKSKIELEFNITLDAIFGNRLFKASRILEFEGIRPSLERLEELKGMLGDLGLESIEVDYADSELPGSYEPAFERTIMQRLAAGEFVAKARRPPNLNINLHSYEPAFERTIEQRLADGEFVVKARRPPNLNINLLVNGKLQHIYRERKQGERADRMRVQTGNMQIIIEGTIQDEPPQTLSILLNRLQQMITERFSHIGMQVV